MSGLIIFETLFFIGVYWIFSLSRIHPFSEISNRHCNINNDLCLFGSFESFNYNFYFHSINDSFALFYSNSNFNINLFGENIITICLNLWILLCVTLLLQFLHRILLINY